MDSLVAAAKRFLDGCPCEAELDCRRAPWVLKRDGRGEFYACSRCGRFYGRVAVGKGRTGGGLPANDANQANGADEEAE